MAALDTNVLVRFLVGDDRQQYAVAKSFIESASSAGRLLFLPLSVVVELEWVLRSRYEFDKKSMIRTFVNLLETKEIEFQVEASIERAIYFYGENNSDFADCLHIAATMTHGHEPLVAFQKAQKGVRSCFLNRGGSNRLIERKWSVLTFQQY